ncbi:hypothetical protein GCM10009527_072490 [Actinomadura nitritigenes]|uniref:Uncharacterized protein n=1 Tax=Actinomadura nitritigenes TaxID=134602 RepID=A0ABS3R5H3_9ACTN|nr:hypothetical protein [Actinomadura nitritigenes]MBO2441406.1 hypothetical protein [Actinomadura nitritigenes]
MGLARRLALNAHRPLGRLALPFLCPTSAALPPWDTGADPDALLAVAFSARDPGARRRAAARIEALWDGEPERRKVIWWLLRERLTSPFGRHSSDHHLSGWTKVADGSAGVPRISWTGIWGSDSGARDQIHLPETVERFLFGPDPDCPHVPRIRLVTGLGLGTAPEAALLLDLALRADDPALRSRCAAVVAETDEPHVLDALENVFSQAFGFWVDRRTIRGELILGRRPELWSDDGTPTPLLSLLLSNPHVPRPPGAESDDGTSYSAVLAALHGRFDLLADFPPGRLIHQMLTVTEDRPGTPADAACRRALRALDEGPAREILCEAAMEDADVDNDAVAAVADAGYLPADPDLVPLFLMLTRQWERLAAGDPDGHRLRDYVVREDIAPSLHGLVRMLEQDAHPHPATAHDDPIPHDAREHALAALRAIGPGAAGNQLCAMAMDGVGLAVRVVAETCLVPVPDNRCDLALFLYRTGQWERYDAADPDGRYLRDRVARLSPYDDERTKLRDAAERGGRPMPCGPRSEPPRPDPYWPGGTGVGGTGGFTSH